MELRNKKGKLTLNGLPDTPPVVQCSLELEEHVNIRGMY